MSEQSPQFVECRCGGVAEKTIVEKITRDRINVHYVCRVCKSKFKRMYFTTAYTGHYN